MLDRPHPDLAPPEAETLPLVLLPGTLCDARLFAPMLTHLKGIDTIVPELRGASSTPDMAAALLATLPPRFALAGFSLGGIVALEMAAQAPERIVGLALLDTTARPDPDDNHLTRREAADIARQQCPRVIPAIST